jgi:isoleucyl-tRNA synthetase
MKDRLYCGDSGGVIEEIFNGLLRMLAPITPHLVEEVWEHRPEWLKAEDHVHPLQRTLNDPVIPASRSLKDENLLNDLPWLMNANAAIKSAQEEARAAKKIGSSLESSIVLDLPEQAKEVFQRYQDELEAIFVVSDVALEGGHDGEWSYSASFETVGGQGKAWVLPPKEHKCPRCWKYVAPVEDELCKRCEDVVSSVQNV